MLVERHAECIDIDPFYDVLSLSVPWGEEAYLQGINHTPNVTADYIELLKFALAVSCQTSLLIHTGIIRVKFPNNW